MRTSVDVHNYLLERDAPHEVFLARGRLRSPDRIAAVLGLSPSAVGRVDVLETERGAIAAVVPSVRDADLRLVAKAAGVTDVRPATPERASELTDYLPDLVPPAGLPKGVRVMLDRALDLEEVLYFPGGEPRAVLKIRGADLRAALRAKVAPLSSAIRASSA